MTVAIETDPHDSLADLARNYARAQDRLADLVEEVRAEQRKVARMRMRALKARAGELVAAHKDLAEAVEAHRDLFDRPKTRTVDGIRYGLRKQPGRVEVDDEAKTMERIGRHMPDWRDTLIRTKRVLNKSALKDLDSRSLAKIGVRLVEVDDVVVVTAAAGDLDKVVEALIGEADEDG